MHSSRAFLYVTAVVLFTCGPCAAAESSAYPLWDGVESIDTYAQRVHLPATRTVDLGGGVSMEFVLIPAGEFRMGTEPPVVPAITRTSAWTLLGIGGGAAAVLLVMLARDTVRRRRLSFSLRWLLAFCLALGVAVGGGVRRYQALRDEDRCRGENAIYFGAHLDERPARTVTIAAPFYMGKFPVTQEQYEKVVGRNAAQHVGPRNPVERVTWYNARDFCRKMRDLVQASGSGDIDVQLPAEAQWEFACRAGTRTCFYTGDTASDLAAAGWFYYNSGKTTHPVGEKPPNKFGLYDMHGNVRQWCAEKFDEVWNPGDRVTRGGSFLDPVRTCEAEIRTGTADAVHYDYVGLRVVMGAAKGP